MTITQLTYFQAICNNESVTKAARRLHISQPALSNAVRDLENEFGLDLFHRRSKRFVLTKEGEYFLSKVPSLLEDFNDIVSNMKFFATTRNNIKIGMQMFTTTFIAPQLITDFHRRQPQIKFDIQELSSEQISEYVATNFLDIGIVNLNTIPEYKFDVYELYSVPLYFCVNKNSKFAGMDKISIAEIGDYPLVLSSNSKYTKHGGIMAAFKNADITPNVFLFTGQYSSIIEYMRCGDCGAFLCREQVEKYDDVVCIRVDEIKPHRIGVIVNKNSHMYSDTSEFLSFLQTWLEEHPELGGIVK